MVDFKKKLNKGEFEKKVNPIEIYNQLDRKSLTGPLRPIQVEILEKWHNEYMKSNDIIIKLHTGEGKTLIGLLILQSIVNQNNGPCIYVCPNKYLVKQAEEEARKFGIQYCTLENETDLPNDFIEGNKILITHVQKIFNGKSKFGIDNKFVKVGTIILDDSHACIDSIKDAFTIKIKRDHVLFDKFISIFENDLINQGEGSFIDIKLNHKNTIQPIPYWAWYDKKSTILELMSEFKTEKFLTFAWPLIKDSLENCNAFISGERIEITPHQMPISKFGSFSKANQRILMSATTQDDSFFIKGLGFSIGAVKNPLTSCTQKWSGEKMIIIPSLIDDSLDRNLIVSVLAKPVNKDYGRVSLVSSNRIAEQYNQIGAVVANSNDIFDKIKVLKNGDYKNLLAIVNRYDGIDLPDESCRILVIDSLPFFISLIDKYEEQCRTTSDLVNIKIAQKIEQGLGRSVRGEKDYSVIIITGTDLVRFVKSSITNKYFSKQTKKQIEIGLEIAELAKDDLSSDENAFTVVSSLIKQSIGRDIGWKEYYSSEMNKLEGTNPSIQIYEILNDEKNAEDAYLTGEFSKACLLIQKIIDKCKNDNSEQGWYMQLMAKYKYPESKLESNKLQKKAFTLNSLLMKPKDGFNYIKIDYMNENRINRIKQWILKYENYDDLILEIENILSNFSFGEESEKFESALKEIGSLLGFISQRPDREFKKGPDNLWCGVDNKYFLIECKSEVSNIREEINKYEIGQMNSHCGWFDETYGDQNVKRILIIPTLNVSPQGNFTHKVEVMRKGKLKEFKDSIKNFIKEFKYYNIHELSDSKIQSFIQTHKLDIKSLENQYTEEYKKRQ
jgi:replicative superfamily II helicase